MRGSRATRPSWPCPTPPTASCRGIPWRSGTARSSPRSTRTSLLSTCRRARCDTAICRSMKGSVYAKLLRREGKLNLLPLIWAQRREKCRRSVDHGAGLAIRGRVLNSLRLDPGKAHVTRSHRQRNGTGQYDLSPHSSPIDPALSVPRTSRTSCRRTTIPLWMSFTPCAIRSWLIR